MDEEMEYAEMLEIPVSTVNVTKKRGRKPKKAQDLKERVITKVNDATETQPSPLEATPATDPTPQTPQTESTPVGTFENSVVAESTPIPIPRRKKRSFFSRMLGKTEAEWLDDTNPLEEESPALETNDSLPIYNYNLWDDASNQSSSKREKRNSLIVAVEFAACCALCLGIFLTNVFMPNSAINTFFRSLGATEEPADTRTYTDFQLSSILSEEDAQLTLSPTGIISFTEEGCIYPAVDGTVETVTQNSDGTWTVKISHSATFSEVISGLSYASCSVGSLVKSNIPLGYSDGAAEVQVSMYESGALLNCFYLTENGDLAWTEE